VRRWSDRTKNKEAYIRYNIQITYSALWALEHYEEMRQWHWVSPALHMLQPVMLIFIKTPNTQQA